MNIYLLPILLALAITASGAERPDYHGAGIMFLKAFYENDEKTLNRFFVRHCVVFNTEITSMIKETSRRDKGRIITVEEIHGQNYIIATGLVERDGAVFDVQFTFFVEKGKITGITAPREIEIEVRLS